MEGKDKMKCVMDDGSLFGLWFREGFVLSQRLDGLQGGIAGPCIVGPVPTCGEWGFSGYGYGYISVDVKFVSASYRSRVLFLADQFPEAGRALGR